PTTIFTPILCCNLICSVFCCMLINVFLCVIELSNHFGVTLRVGLSVPAFFFSVPTGLNPWELKRKRAPLQSLTQMIALIKFDAKVKRYKL
ncbi:MAG TPA: hypothetical protein VJU52_12255, partial [Flavobacterium sp.]|nr:hypothetical protein [Flavobacterium sp.]